MSPGPCTLRTPGPLARPRTAAVSNCHSRRARVVCNLPNCIKNDRGPWDWGMACSAAARRTSALPPHITAVQIGGSLLKQRHLLHHRPFETSRPSQQQVHACEHHACQDVERRRRTSGVVHMRCSQFAVHSPRRTWQSQLPRLGVLARAFCWASATCPHSTRFEPLVYLHPLSAPCLGQTWHQIAMTSGSDMLFAARSRSYAKNMMTCSRAGRASRSVWMPP